MKSAIQLIMLLGTIFAVTIPAHANTDESTSASAKDRALVEKADTPRITATDASSVRIIFLGDSLTEGFGVPSEAAYPSLIEAKLKADGINHVEIVNGGISGATTSGAARRLGWHLRGANKPQILVLALGANDGLRGLDLNVSRKNLEETIVLAKQNDMKVILSGMKIPPNYGKDYAQSFEKMYEELASKHDITLIPFLLEGVAAQAELNLADGIHPNEKGYRIVAETVYKYLLPKIDKK